MMDSNETGNEQLDPAEEHFWREAAKLLESQATQMRRAIETCLKKDLWEPGLILILSFIDACAWLARPRDHLDVSFTDFVSWVNTYLLPESKLECTAEELYGARCGLLHSLTGESRLHREDRIRKIFWSRATGTEIYTLIQVRMNEKHLPVGVGIDHLFWALGKALIRFETAISKDDELARLVAERVYQSYFTKVRRVD